MNIFYFLNLKTNMLDQKFLRYFIPFAIVWVLMVTMISFLPDSKSINEKHKAIAENCVLWKLKEQDILMGEYKFDSFKIIDNGRPFTQIADYTFEGEKYFCEVDLFDEPDEIICSATCWTNYKK